MREQWGVPVLASILIFSLGSQPPPASATEINVLWSVATDDQGTLTINQGDTVTWTWDDAIVHNVVAVAGPELFDSGFVTGLGFTFSHTFTLVGVYSIQCAVHLNMVMDIVVNAVAPPPNPAIGGTLIAIDKTALLVAGAQTMTPWLVLGVVSAVGIGLAVFTLKRNH